MAYIVPSVVTSLLMVLTFLIPPSVSERVTSSLIVYVSYTVLALAASNTIRIESQHVPVLGKYNITIEVNAPLHAIWVQIRTG